MYCPRCGHQPISASLRFCSYCGLKLGVVKASLADEDEGSGSSFTIQVIPKELRQRDINIGVILMFAGKIHNIFAIGAPSANRNWKWEATILGNHERTGGVEEIQVINSDRKNGIEGRSHS